MCVINKLISYITNRAWQDLTGVRIETSSKIYNSLVESKSILSNNSPNMSINVNQSCLVSDFRLCLDK